MSTVAVVQHPFQCAPNCFGTLTAGGFSLNTWGWMIQDLRPLWFEASYIGDNRVVPGSPGRVGYPNELDEGFFSLVFWVTGAYTSLGVAYSDPVVGLQTNLDAIIANVTGPVTTGTGSRSCVLDMPTGANRNANVQFDPLRARDLDDIRLCEFVISGSILEGRFT